AGPVRTESESTATRTVRRITEDPMSHYLLSIYQPYGETMDQFPDAEFLEPIMREVDALKEDMRRQGVSVYEGGLHAPTTATVLRAHGDDVVTTDGPFAEAKEHLGGITVIDV